MESKMEIVDILAREKRVESLVVNISHRDLDADLKDLCQMVYVILLDYDESKLQDLWVNNQINFFIARIILNQYRSSNSPFHSAFRKVQNRSVHIGVGCDINDDAIERIRRQER